MTIALQAETWGTYSVRDHCRRRPFVADVLLYDRLVIPYPPDEYEAERWKSEGWQPGRLKECLQILGELAVPVPWNEQRRRQFKDQRSAASQLDPYYTTSLQMKLEFELNVPKESIPNGVDSIRPIAAYQSWDDFKISFNPTPVTDVRRPDMGSLIAVLAHEFLVPEDPELDDMKSLEAAAELARDDEFRGERNIFHRWLDDKIRARSIEKDVVSGLNKKINVFKWAKRFDRVRFIAKYAHWTLELAPAAALIAGIDWHTAAVGEAVVRFASFGLERLAEPGVHPATPAALFYDAEKRLGL
jgi:hypothetical protein